MKQYAIIRNSKLEYEDYHRYKMWWFDAYINEHNAALQIQPLQELVSFLDAVGKPLNVENANEQPCLVEVENGLILYLGPVRR